MKNTILVKDRHGRTYDFKWVEVKNEAGTVVGAQLAFDDPLFEKTWIIARYTLPTAANKLYAAECYRYKTTLLPAQFKDLDVLLKVCEQNALFINGLERVAQ